MKSLASRRFLPLSAAEYAVYQTYERQRRQRLLAVMLPLSALLFVVISLFLTVRIFFFTAPIVPSDWGIYGATLLITLFFLLGTLAIRRRQTILAALLMMLTGGLSMLFVITFQVFFVEGLDVLTLSEFLLFGCVIVLVGVLSNLWTVVGTTLLVNVLTLLVIYQAPLAQQVPVIGQDQRTNVALAVLILEWLIAAFLIANWLTYRQTLRTLGEAYERVYQAERLDELKDQFITHINHELRTPIMALHGYVEYLREAQPQLSDAELALALEKASRTGNSLVALLSSILEVRRIDGKTDTFVPTAVPVRAALETALTLIDPRETKRGGEDVHVALPENLAIWGEPVRFQQILTNLLSNALKYSPPGSPIEVTARTVILRSASQRRQHGGNRGRSMVEIRVRDYGLGIPPQEAPLLFNRFVRLPRDLASSVVGNGLGLYLCRVMAESMQGTIRVESSGVEGEGSTFFVRLPLAPPQYRQEVEPAPAEQAAGGNDSA